MPTKPDIRWERAFWDCGMTRIAAVDEVGRGALAGPLVAAVVILPAPGTRTRRGWNRLTDRVRDSKVMSPSARTEAAQVVCEVADCWAIGSVAADELDRIGLQAANRIAMERALAAISGDIDAILLDACTVDHHSPQVGLIDGDARSLSIAAASIIAKVHRDGLMDARHEVDSRYRFDLHKGYGTAVHLAALREHGPSDIHRTSFAPVAMAGRR